jgi:hypothetical protein
MVASVAAGFGLLNSEAGLPVPIDPGTVVVRVVDQSNAPMSGVPVEIGNIPRTAMRRER